MLTQKMVEYNHNWSLKVLDHFVGLALKGLSVNGRKVFEHF